MKLSNRYPCLAEGFFVMYLWYLLSIGIVAFSISLQAFSNTDSEKQGYWWYEDPIIEHQKGPYPKPALPNHNDMMAMHPKELGALLESHRNYAVYTLEPTDVANYYRVQDVVRRKAAAFTSLSQYVLLQNPELNANSAYPTTNTGRTQQKQQINQMIDDKLLKVKNQYALGFFTALGCSYCAALRPTVAYFQDKHGWRIEEIDIDAQSDLRNRFNVTITPMLIVIEKDSQRWLPVAVGLAPLTTIEQNTYRAVRLLLGEIEPQQFFTTEQTQGGFFDPSYSGGT